MKKLLATAAFAVIAIAGTGAALADGYTEKSYHSHGCATADRFKGAYIGGTVGLVDWRTDRADVDNFGNLGGLVAFGNGPTYTHKDDRFALGATVGYNMVTCNALIGVEADWSWVDGRKSQSEQVLNGLIAGSRQVDSRMDWLATLRGRAGIVNHNLLLYVTGGLAFADIGTSFQRIVPQLGLNETASFSDTRWGYVVGAGAELALTSSISVKSEALYVSFEDDSTSFKSNALGRTFNYNFHANDDMWLIRTGVNIKLNREDRVTPMK